MKRLMVLIMAAVMAISAIACTTGNKSDAIDFGKPAIGTVRVIYFHGSHRCTTCRTIEALTMEVAKSSFENEQKSGGLRFESIDLDTPEGEKLAGRYEVAWSSLLIVKNDMVVNLTDMAFSKAKNKPEEFKENLKSEIRKILE